MATLYVYGAFLSKMLNKEVDWDSDTIKVLLCTSSYTPNQDTHDYADDLTNEVANGNGYTTGGATLASKTATYDAGNNRLTLDAADVVWAASTITARYAVIYDSTPGSAATNPLIAYIDFGSDVSSSSGNFTITWDSNGIIRFAL